MLDAASLDRAIASLRRAGYEPYVVLDVGEDEQLPRATSAHAISRRSEG